MEGISVFLPAYNEEENIRPILKEIDSFLNELKDDYEILVVDGCSTDDTKQIAEEMAEENDRIRIVEREKGKDYGFALRTGFLEARKALIFYTDADRQFDIRELKGFFPYLEDYELVIGYRKDRKDPWPRLLISKVFNLISNFFLGMKIKDWDCAFKLCKKEVIDEIEDFKTTRSVDLELLVKAKKNGFEIKQLPVKHYSREKGESEAEIFGGLVKPNIILKSLKDLFYLMKVRWA